MLHHVGLEIAAADLARAREFWRIVGLEEVEPPGSLSGRAVWFESGGDPRTQIHLMVTDDPVAPPEGHAALVVTDYGRAVSELRAADFDVDDRRPHWGSPRCFCRHPGGHRIELMREPPR